ncbi:MAG: hypothetical protein HN380_14860 [Victivallales bacterium]|nr:hypothetical protein [Victivallales bacterium]
MPQCCTMIPRVPGGGARYHVINRGNVRFPVSREVRDRELLLGKLVGLAERLQARISVGSRQDGRTPTVALPTMVDGLVRGIKHTAAC